MGVGSRGDRGGQVNTNEIQCPPILNIWGLAQGGRGTLTKFRFLCPHIWGLAQGGIEGANEIQIPCPPILNIWGLVQGGIEGANEIQIPCPPILNISMVIVSTLKYSPEPRKYPWFSCVYSVYTCAMVYFLYGIYSYLLIGRDSDIYH